MLEHVSELGAGELHDRERVGVRIEPKRVAHRHRSGRDPLPGIEHRRQRHVGVRRLELRAVDQLPQRVVRERRPLGASSGLDACPMTRLSAVWVARSYGAANALKCGVGRRRVRHRDEPRAPRHDGPARRRVGALGAGVRCARGTPPTSPPARRSPCRSGARDLDVRVAEHDDVGVRHLGREPVAPVLVGRIVGGGVGRRCSRSRAGETAAVSRSRSPLWARARSSQCSS